MNSRPPRHEKILYLFAFLLAFGLRFIRLGELPLTDSEARLALDALNIVKGENSSLSSHVAYTNLTAILFFVFSSSNFLARIWPALAGTALICVPLLFRDWLKPRTAILLAFLLAIDPALVALSRQAGGPILAVSASLLAAGFWFCRQPRPAGIFLALALLSGPSLWAGLLGILLAWMLSQFMSSGTGVKVDESTQGHTETSTQVDTYTTGTHVDTETSTPASTSDSSSPIPHPPSSSPAPNPYLLTPIPQFLTALVITLFSTSTLLLLAPQGLGTWLTSLPEYFRGWLAPGLLPISRLFFALGVYQFFGILFVLAAIVRGWVHSGRRVIRLSLWMLVALLLAVFYPAHQTSDLIWVILPVWTLAALELSRHLELIREDRLETFGVFVFTLLLLAFAWINFNYIFGRPPGTPDGNRHIILFFGSLLLLVLSLFLVGFGWSTRIARVGSMWGTALMLGTYTLGAAWGATGLRDAKAVEIWDSSPRIAQANLLLQTVEKTSEWATGQADDLPVTVQGVDSPALLWMLRNHNPSVSLALDPGSTPALIITPLRVELGLPSAYRGQDFNWRVTPVWDSFSSFYYRWLTYRDLPTSPETIILWVRNDLFIDVEQP